MYQLTVYDSAALCGIGKSSVSYWETGKRIPAIDGLYSIATAYGVSLDWLCGVSDIRYTPDSVSTGEDEHPMEKELLEEILSFPFVPINGEECLMLERAVESYTHISQRKYFPLEARADILVIAHHLYNIFDSFGELDEYDTESTKINDYEYYLSLLIWMLINKSPLRSYKKE